MGDEDEELEARAEAVMDALRAAVIRLLRDGGASPQLVALAVVRVAGELSASIAVADGIALERVLDELAEFLERAGHEHHELVRLGAIPSDPAPAQSITPSLVTGKAPARDGHRAGRSRPRE